MVQVCDDDQFMYCGTTSGDVLKVNMKTCLFTNHGPLKDKYSLGISTLQILPSGNLMISTGSGKVAAMNAETYKQMKSCTVEGGVTSLALNKKGHEFFIGTSTGNLYHTLFGDFKPTPIMSCHNNPITDVTFPLESSELFVTSSINDVRVWHAASGKELLRLSIPNLTCNAVNITNDGHAVITGWNDGKIRAFYPESGQPMYTIHDAHNKGVTALATLSHSRTIVSGGGEGQVRLWVATAVAQKMKEALKEHRGAVTCIRVRKNDQECITSSNDGTCIVWDLVRCVRNQVIFANTMFKAVCYHPDECQVITGGTDRKIGYWDTYDGGQIRELDGSKTGSIDGMDITNCGSYFVTGGSDRVVKVCVCTYTKFAISTLLKCSSNALQVWLYNEGEVSHKGTGHSGDIVRIKISPDGQHIVSVSADGGILRWKFPIFTPNN